jgi:hypothetical protein
VTISVEMEDLVGEIYTGDSITDTAAVRYTLDSNRAPISFSIAID